MRLEDIDLADLDFFRDGDRFEAWRIMRAEAPIYWHERKPGAGFWSLTMMRDSLAVLADAHLFSSELQAMCSTSSSIATAPAAIPASARCSTGPIRRATKKFAR